MTLPLESPVGKIGPWLASGTWIWGGLPPCQCRACRGHEDSATFTEHLLSFRGSGVVGDLCRPCVKILGPGSLSSPPGRHFTCW